MAALCRRRLSEGTSATLVQVGFQPVTNPLLEQTEDAYSFPIIRLFHMIDTLVYGKFSPYVKMQCDFLTKRIGWISQVISEGDDTGYSLHLESIV